MKEESLDKSVNAWDVADCYDDEAYINRQKYLCSPGVSYNIDILVKKPLRGSQSLGQAVCVGQGQTLPQEARLFKA